MRQRLAGGHAQRPRDGLLGMDGQGYGQKRGRKAFQASPGRHYRPTQMQPAVASSFPGLVQVQAQIWPAAQIQSLIILSGRFDNFVFNTLPNRKTIIPHSRAADVNISWMLSSHWAKLSIEKSLGSASGLQSAHFSGRRGVSLTYTVHRLDRDAWIASLADGIIVPRPDRSWDWSFPFRTCSSLSFDNENGLKKAVATFSIRLQCWG
jgi:hypothetical protein